MFVRLILLMVCGVAATHNKMVWVPKTTASNPTTTTPGMVYILCISKPMYTSCTILTYFVSLKSIMIKLDKW